MPLRDELNSNNPFQIEITQDGSPTLRLRDSSGLGESMHNLKGAFSETLYIYLPTLQRAFEWQEPETRLLSVGLGLGYNELSPQPLHLKIIRTTPGACSVTKQGFSSPLLHELARWKPLESPKLILIYLASMM
ncbi:MAG: hypothetical protein IPJ71_17000 [Bdellovibrionales bacterium]|nr:hypothetical protein [Bdellovibrionales bacterium]